VRRIQQREFNRDRQDEQDEEYKEDKEEAMILFLS
jgi:hypothetical protein